MNWIYKDKEIENFEDFKEPNAYGFIYKITDKETGKFYIGKKNFYFDKKRKIGKKELAQYPKSYFRKYKSKGGKWIYYEQSIEESDWKDYYSSSKDLLKEIKKNKNKDRYKREILQLAFYKKQLTYLEVVYQIKEEVLKKDTFNNNILGKFHRQDFVLK